MTLTLHIDPTWLAHPDQLGRLIEHCRALESACPWMPPPPARLPGDDREDALVGNHRIQSLVLDFRLPGDDDGDDLVELLAGMDAVPAPPPAAPRASAPIVVPAPAPRASAAVPTFAPKSPAIPPPSPVPTTGQALYRWLCDSRMLPRASAIGKRRQLDRMITHWEPGDVAAVWTELQAPPATSPPVEVNGRRRH